MEGVTSDAPGEIAYRVTGEMMILPANICQREFITFSFATKADGMTNQIASHDVDRILSRDATWALLTEFTQSASLLKHALAVESCVRAYGHQEANRRGLVGDDASTLVDLYSATGLLHDFDYERHPSTEEHPWIGVRILEERGWPQEIRHAILGHAEYTGPPRVSPLDKTLFACDELAGFLTACALIKPSKSIHDVKVDGVRRKLKDKAFAR